MIGGFIGRIEKYLQLDLEYYIRNSLYLILARGTVMSSGLLLSVAFAHLVTKEVFGQWNYIFSIMGIVAILTLPGINTAITQSVATGHDRILVEGTKQRFKWSILGSLAIIGVGVYYFLSGSALLGKGLIISSLFFPFYQNFQSYAAFLSGKKQFDRLAKYRIITQLIVVLATITVIYLSRNLMLIIAANLFSFAVLRGYFFRLTFKNMENQSSDPEAIPFGKHMTVTQIPATIRQHYDKLIIALFLSFPELAIYSIAWAFSNLLNPFRSIIASLIFPKLSQMDKETAYSEVKKRWPLIILGFGIICGILIIFCPYIIPLLYSQQYADSILYAQLLLVSIVIAAPVPIINKALFPSQRRIKDLYKLRILSSVIGIVLLTFLVLNFGSLGAVIAIILTRAFSMVYSLKLAGFISFRPSPQARK